MRFVSNSLYRLAAQKSKSLQTRRKNLDQHTHRRTNTNRNSRLPLVSLKDLLMLRLIIEYHTHVAYEALLTIRAALHEADLLLRSIRARWQLLPRERFAAFTLRFC